MSLATRYALLNVIIYLCVIYSNVHLDRNQYAKQPRL